MEEQKKEIESLRGQIENLETSITSVRKELSGLQSEALAREESLALQQEEKLALESQLSETSFTNNRISELNERLADVTAQMKTLEGEKQELKELHEAEILKLNSELNKARDSSTDLDSQIQHF